MDSTGESTYKIKRKRVPIDEVTPEVLEKINALEQEIKSIVNIFYKENPTSPLDEIIIGKRRGKVKIRSYVIRGKAYIYIYEEGCYE